MNGDRVNQPSSPPAPPAGEGSQAGGNQDAQHKAIAIVGYIIPVLFFIPLLSEAKNNAYAKFHANQQLNLLLWWVVGHVVAAILMFILIGALLYVVVYVGGVIFLVMGVINAANGQMKPLPLIGKIQLIK